MRHFLPTILCFLLSLLASTSASPIEDRAPTKYYLQTKVVNGTKDSGSKKGGLYVYAYHTGAGTNDAVLSSNKSIAEAGYLNGTAFSFNLGALVYNVTLEGDTNYAGWEPVVIDATYPGTPSFSINNTQLVGAASYGFEGWLACDWWHGMPQLFYLVSGYQIYQKIPTSCSTVHLEVVAK